MPVPATVARISAMNRPFQVGATPRSRCPTAPTGSRPANRPITMIASRTNRSIQPSGRRRRSVRALTPRMFDHVITTISATGMIISPALLSKPRQNDREVVRHRRGDQREHDRVVEQDRPAGDEADELVEREARERRGAAALDVQRRALDVRHEREDEEDARRAPSRPASGRGSARRSDRARSTATMRPRCRRP